MNNNLTINERVTMAQALINDVASGGSNGSYYLGVGRCYPWAANDTYVTTGNAATTDSTNIIYKDLVALKLINAATACNVIRRADWIADIAYTAYSNSLPIFSTVLTTNANGTVSVSGSSNTSSIIIDDIFTVQTANQNTFSLTANVSNTDFVIVTINGLVQTPNVDFNIISNTALVLTSNATFGSIVEAKVFETVFSTVIVYDVFAVNIANQNTFSLSSNATSNDMILTVNGLVQSPNVNFNIVGNTSLVLFANAHSGDIVEAKLFTSVFTPGANGSPTTIVGNNTTFLLDFSDNDILQLPGDNITIFPQQREIISITSNNILTVNLAFNGNIIANTPQQVQNTYPNYAYNFYVRNTYDQVFICLGNNNSSLSTVMPQISIGGDLPSDSYIVTSDGYLWKYLYTISSGQKQLFFDQNWMPVGTDPNVIGSAQSGRLDVIKIINGGNGYNNSSASFNAPILVVTGDGIGANLTAQVNATGTITGVNVLNGGSGYTYANVTANTGVTGVNAALQAVIGPPGGWGSNNLLQLGATTAMISVTLDDTEDDTIPTVDVLGSFFNYRQITILQNPLLAANDVIATGLNYDMTTSLPLPGNTAFPMNSIIYQSSNGNFAAATFYATVVYFDVSTFNLHINKINGNFTSGQPIYSTNSSLTAVTFNSVPSLIEPGSGNIVYVENRLPIERSPGQTENLKVVVSF